MTIREAPTATLREWLAELRAIETQTAKSRRVAQTVRIRIRAIELTLEDRKETP